MLGDDHSYRARWAAAEEDTEQQVLVGKHSRVATDETRAQAAEQKALGGEDRADAEKGDE